MSSAKYGRCYQFLLSSAWESLTFEQLPWFLYDSSAGLGLVAPKACQNHLMWQLTASFPTHCANGNCRTETR